MKDQKGLQIGQKVHFEYWDSDLCKDIYGTGWVTEIDKYNGIIHIQTTRKLHWIEYDHQMKNIRII